MKNFEDKKDFKNDRFLDVDREPRRMLQPIEGYQKLPLVSLDEAIEPTIVCCPDIRRRAYIAKENCQNPSDGLNQNESASIYLYTMEWEPREQCLYYILNATLRTENRQKLKPWLLYLKLILTALGKLPTEQQTIWRGVKCNLNQQYENGKRYIWWSLSSCTTSLAVLESDQFLGKQGNRTLFNIDCQDGRSIQSHSSVHVENEFILPPAVQIEVVSQLDTGDGLTIIQVKQVQAPFPLIEAPSIVSIKPNKNLLDQNIKTYENEYLKQLIAKNSSIARQGLTDVDVPYVLDHCLIGKDKKSFDISFNRITEKGAVHIGKAVHANTTLNILDMRQNLLSDMGTHWIAIGLQNHNALRIIYLCENQISDEGAKFLGETLKTNKILEKLFLWKNQITDIGTKYLAEALMYNSILKLLDLQGNRITDEGVKHLVQMLKQNQALTDLYLSENLITNVGVLFLFNMLRYSRGLKALRIDNLDTSDECFQAIDNMFRNNYALAHLYLSVRSYSIDEQNRFQQIAKLKPGFKVIFLP